jgi:hypothetical protein
MLTDIRRATAYSFKFERIPDKQEYSGNLYNLSGTTKAEVSTPTIAPLALEFKILVNPDFNCFSLFACGLPRHSGIATK